MKRIQSKKHKIRTCKINKISLSWFDNKIFVLDDGIHTFAYFHKDLKKKKFLEDKNKCSQMKVGFGK